MTQPPPDPAWAQPQHWPAMPYGAPAQRTNVLAILSLVFAFLCFPVGLVLGIIALVQLRTSGDGGKGLAIAGVAVSSALVALIGVGIALAVVYGGDYGPEGRVAQVGSSVVGTCLTGLSEDEATSEVVDCAQEHEEEVSEVQYIPSDAWPGSGYLDDRSDDICFEAFENYVGRGYYSSDLDYGWYRPDQAEWDDGEHRVVCVVTGHVGSGDGSVRGTRR